MKKYSSSILMLLFAAVLAVGGYYLYASDLFEREAPAVEVPQVIHWNLKDPIRIKISDNVSLRSYKIVLADEQSEAVVAEEFLSEPKKEVTVEVNFPKAGVLAKANKAFLRIEALDNSNWNFFAGNETKKESQIFIDTRRPNLFVVTNSYGIAHGGAALVVFNTTDEHLGEVYIETNFKKRFKVQPFYKEGYYIALVAWPVQESGFGASVVAKDLAGNVSRSGVRFFLKEKSYRSSNIELKEVFLDGKIADLASEYRETLSMNKIEKFKFINETLRGQNDKLIHEITSMVSDEMVSDFAPSVFYPLKNAAAVASFGDHRYFYYGGNLVSESYHMGLDLASVAMSDIVASNPAQVVYADNNGIYGNMPILYHGLGLYTLYGHCSSMKVSKGDMVAAGQVIAQTGNTGLALGDHLHFGVLVQGIEVKPDEWLDANWIKLNILDVISNAKALIDHRP